MNINYNFYISCPFCGFKVNIFEINSVDILNQHMEMEIHENKNE